MAIHEVSIGPHQITKIEPNNCFAEKPYRTLTGSRSHESSEQMPMHTLI